MIKKKPVLICFTGIDGSGKSTLAKGLVSSLNKRGIRCKYVYARFEPFILKPFILIGKLIFLRGKNIFKDYKNYSGTKKKATEKHHLLSWIYQQISLLDYYLQALFKVRLPLLMGRNIICDRYLEDVAVNLAVELNYSNVKLKSVLNKIQRRLPEPDLVFLADVPEEIAYQRKKDVPSIEYLKERRQLYLWIQKEYDMVTLDGCKSITELEITVMDFAAGKWQVSQIPERSFQ